MSDFFSVARKNNNKNGYCLWSQDQIDYICKHYQKYNSTGILAKEFNVSLNTIRTLIKKQGIQMLTLEKLQRKRYPIIQDYFENIDTPEKAYWLGFLCADGYISKQNGIRLELKKGASEYLTLENFLKAIKNEHTSIIEDSRELNEKINYSYYVSFKCKKMTKDLAKHGCVNNKSLILAYPSTIPQELDNHFIRGYFDGDGSIKFSVRKNKYKDYSILFIGTENMLKTIRSKLNKNNLSLENCGNFHRLQISGNQQLRLILNYIYSSSTESTRLKYKYERYLDFKTTVLEG